MKKHPAVACFIISSVLFLSPRARRGHADMVFDQFDPDQHNRFDSGSTFIGDGFDWSGVGREVTASGGVTRWATLVEPNFFLSADHSHPAPGKKVRFWETNSSSSAIVERTVMSGQRVGGTDLWIGRLNSPVPSSIQPFDLATMGISDISTDLESFGDQLIFTVGRRNASPNGFVVGQNRYDVGDATSAANGSFDAIGFIQARSDNAGFVNYISEHETFFQVGDSGAPSFVVEGSPPQLMLAGIHTYIVENANSTNSSNVVDVLSANGFVPDAPDSANISYDNFIPNYAAEIAAITAIPETSAVAMWMMLLGVGWCCRVRGLRR